MSTFECRNGHLIRSKDKGKCPQCGEGVYYMDGKSAAELEREEQWHREHERDRQED